MFGHEDSPLLLIAIAACAVIIHLPLIWIRRYCLAPLYLGLFILVDPLSATADGQVSVLKYARVYLSGLVVVSALFSTQRLKLGAASKVFLIFAGYFAISALWSDHPVQAIASKGLIFLVALIAGIAAGDQFRSPERSRNAIRLLGVIATAASIAILPQALLSIAKGERMAAFDINPIRMGMSLVAFFTFALVGLFLDDRKLFKVIFGAASVLSAIAIVATGSRGPAGAALIVGSSILVFGLRWNIYRIVLASTIGVGLVWAMTTYMSRESLNQLNRQGLTGREAIWEQVFWASDGANPLIGKGWLYQSGSIGGLGSTNMHNAYLQVYVESGAIGCVLLAISVCVVLVVGGRAWLSIRRMPDKTWKIYLAMAMGLVLAGLGQAIAESAILMGTTAATVLYGLALGIIDRIALNSKLVNRRIIMYGRAHTAWLHTRVRPRLAS